MRRDLKPVGSRRTGETTIARRLSAVSSFYSYAVDQDARPSNPVKTMKRPQPVGVDEDRVAWLDTAQSKAFLAAARAHSARAFALAAVMLTTGCRTTEALAADVSDWSWRGGHRFVTVTRKGGKRQALPLAPWVGEAVDTYLDGRADGPLFATAARSGHHGRMDEPALWRPVKRLATKAGLPAALVADLHPHSLPHSAITGALEAGGSLRDVQAMAGHADARTTERYDRLRCRLDSIPVYALAAALAD
ncbi:integrase/recombinase XerD [Streptacidiphilus sp. MAP12-16]